ncbi:hypothetical protein MKW94_025057, partial [Papaver nudicaule]|nr:hypothetical protein [Papaver nudicaule]
IAMNLIQQTPDLAILKDESGTCALEVMAERPYAFPSSSQLRPWQRFIYTCWSLLNQSFVLHKLSLIS